MSQVPKWLCDLDQSREPPTGGSTKTNDLGHLAQKEPIMTRVRGPPHTADSVIRTLNKSLLNESFIHPRHPSSEIFERMSCLGEPSSTQGHHLTVLTGRWRKACGYGSRAIDAITDTGTRPE